MYNSSYSGGMSERSIMRARLSSRAASCASFFFRFLRWALVSPLGPAFTISMIIWNTLWLTEVILHQQLTLIESTLSWVIFVFSELTFSIGIAYFFIEIVTNPKILKFEKIYDIIPNSLCKIIEENLEKVLNKKKLYLNPNLNLNTLANETHVSPPDLTTYLNKILNKNFNQFITDFRIEESKSLLNSIKENKLNIEQVMYSSGFNSKSVFNTAFKNRTGMTPSEYKKQVKA